MEKDFKRKRSKKVGSVKRSPLQELNHEIHGKRSGINDASASFEIPKGCPKLLLHCSTSSSSSGTVVYKKPRSLANLGTNFAAGSVRCEENGERRKPLDKVKRKQPPLVSQRKSGKNHSKPTLRNDHRSNVSSDLRNQGNKLKKPVGEFEKRVNNFPENAPGEPPIEHFNPIRDCSSKFSFDFSGKMNRSEDLIEDSVRIISSGDCNTAVKTPPVEPSVSPEIQSMNCSKIMVLKKDSDTPICYGAGHLVSGLPDKRKCRSRGILIGGCEKTNLFSDENYVWKASNESLTSSIRVPNEASVRWLLSPCDELCEEQMSDSRKLVNKIQDKCDNAFDAVNLSSSPSVSSGNESNLESGGNVNTCISMARDAAKKENSRFVALTPLSSSREKECLGYDLSVDNSAALSIGSLSNGNVIQTPDSDMSPDACVRPGFEVHESNLFQFELDSITSSLSRVRLSPEIEIPMWDAPGLGLNVTGMDERKQQNVESVSSLISDCTFEDLALSQMRISWRDASVGRISEADESECCLCLSDEEVDAYRHAAESSSQKVAKTDLRFDQDGDSGTNGENRFRFSSDIFSKALDHRSIISCREEKERFLDRHGECAESICTNGGDVVASADSDWANCFEKHLHEI